MKTVTHLSQTSFIDLLRYIVNDLGVKRVFFSQKTPVCKTEKPHPSSCVRIDITISYKKHMIFANQNKIQDIYMQPGDIHYCPPLCWKLPRWDSLHTMASIIYYPDYIRFTYIDYDRITSVYEQKGAAIYYHTSTPISVTGSAILHALNNYAESDSRSGSEVPLMQSLLKLTLEELENDHTQSFGKAHISWMHINNYLHENFCYPINLAHVAQKFGMNASYISRLFSKEGPESFTTTLRRLRMDHAVFLLSNTSLPLKDICEECGYLSTTFFIAAFKKYTGMPPGQYRCHHKK